MEKRLLDIIKKEEESLKSDKDYRKLSEFLEFAEKEGLSQKKEYSYPLTDTIGKRFHESISYRAKND